MISISSFFLISRPTISPKTSKPDNIEVWRSFQEPVTDPQLTSGNQTLNKSFIIRFSSKLSTEKLNFWSSTDSPEMAPLQFFFLTLSEKKSFNLSWCCRLFDCDRYLNSLQVSQFVIDLVFRTIISSKHNRTIHNGNSINHNFSTIGMAPHLETVYAKSLN